VTSVRKPWVFLPAVLTLAVLSSLVAQDNAQDRDTRVAGVTTRFIGRELQLDAALSPSLPSEIGSYLASGLPTTTTWRIRLLLFRSFWFNSFKDERLYEVTATYRPVTADYSVERRLDEKLLDTRLVPTREEAAAALSRLKSLPVFIMGRHLLGKSLTVKVCCRYGHGFALGVVPTRVETAWARSGVFEWTEPGSP
jgi:hypothetical protein